MLFLQNIPTSQKVTLRNLLDSDNASLMNHPLVKYTNSGIRFNCENETLEDEIIDTYFGIVNPFDIYENVGDSDYYRKRSSEIISLFRYWSPQHFYQIHQRIIRLDNLVKQYNAINNFTYLLTRPELTNAANVMDYMLRMNAAPNSIQDSKVFQITDSLYMNAILNNHLALIRWMDTKSPILSHGLDKFLYIIFVHNHIEIYQWIVTKYANHIRENIGIHQYYASMVNNAEISRILNEIKM